VPNRSLTPEHRNYSGQVGDRIASVSTLVAEPFTLPFCNAWTLAPLIAVPPELLDTVPDRVPVVML